MKQLAPCVYHTGVFNPAMRVFDVIMRTEYGTSYNSYVVAGSEKTAVIEASHASFTENFISELQAVLGECAPDYIILNHTEPDHSGSVNAVLEKYPDIQIVTTKAASIYIKNITNRHNLNIKTVKDGDILSLGDKSLRFIVAPFLHWPDSMFTYLEKENILFSCDFFGAHFCEPAIYDSKSVYKDKYFESAKYYYDCIFGPFPAHVQSGLTKIAGIPLKLICPSHGPVLTPEGFLDKVWDFYKESSTIKESKIKRIPLFYCTAYGNTQRIAEAIREGILSVLPDGEVTAFNIIECDQAMLAQRLNSSDAFLIGALTINRDAVPPIWNLLSGIDAINIQKRPAALFGSYGWSGEAFANVASRLSSLKCAVYEKQFKINFVPTENDLKDAAAFGKEFAACVSK